MPLMFLEVPTGLDREAKPALLSKLTEVIDNAYHFPDTRVFLREYAEENVATDGAVGTPVRPVVFLEAPELASLDVKRSMVAAIQEAIAEYYAGLADADQTLVLINEYPLHNVGWLKQLQSDNSMIVNAVDALNR